MIITPVDPPAGHPQDIIALEDQVPALDPVRVITAPVLVPVVEVIYLAVDQAVPAVIALGIVVVEVVQVVVAQVVVHLVVEVVAVEEEVVAREL
jgi:hypothetical protein